jgi:hypothetical protein
MRFRRTALLLLIFPGLFPEQVSSQDRDGFTISGRVLASGTREPVYGATVGLWLADTVDPAIRTLTDLDGRFRLEAHIRPATPDSPDSLSRRIALKQTSPGSWRTAVVGPGTYELSLRVRAAARYPTAVLVTNPF